MMEGDIVTHSKRITVLKCNHNRWIEGNIGGMTEFIFTLNRNSNNIGNKVIANHIKLKRYNYIEIMGTY